MFRRKDKEILEYTKKISKGTFMLASMSNKQFISIYKNMENGNLKKTADYQIPDWFTIKFIPHEKNSYQFIGSFNDGNGFPIVYKDIFLKNLKRNKVTIEQIDDETYKITREPLV